MTTFFDRYYRQIISELSQRTVNQANFHNQNLRNNNPVAAQRAQRFHYKTRKYSHNNNSLIKTISQDSTTETEYQIDDVQIDPNNSSILYIRAQAYNARNPEENPPDLKRANLKFNIPASVLTDMTGMDIPLVFYTKDDAIRFTKKVFNSTGVRLAWKSLEFK